MKEKLGRNSLKRAVRDQRAQVKGYEGKQRSITRQLRKLGKSDMEAQARLCAESKMVDKDLGIARARLNDMVSSS